MAGMNDLGYSGEESFQGQIAAGAPWPGEALPGARRAASTPDRDNSRPGCAVFWMLLGMGFLTLAPCILLPEWRELQRLQCIGRIEARKVEQLRRAISHEKEIVEAIQNDPAVVARLAQRDLGFRGVGDTWVRVNAVAPVTAPQRSFRNEGVDLSIEATLAQAPWLGFHWDAVFCHAPTRSLLVLMSVSLIALAILLFPQRRPSTDR